MVTMQIQKLITDIIPHYNYYRKNKLQITGSEAIEIMWEIGDLLKEFVAQNDIAPHKLYREIYGKSEGVENTTQKSYITREFLSRSLRVRNMFDQKSDIRKIFPHLQYVKHFREAMPFFDNSKYVLSGKKRSELLAMLNSKNDPKIINAYIKRLQDDIIGISNPRDQKLDEMTGDKEIFVEFYNYIYSLFELKDYAKASKKMEKIDSDLIKFLSKNVGAISMDGLQMQEFDIPEKCDEKWVNFAQLIKRLIIKRDSVERRRFRRLIPPHRMTQLAEMLHQLTSEELYKTFRP